MSEGLYSHTTRAVGTILTAEIYNSDHQNHITNHNPAMMGGFSDTIGQMQSVADPGSVGTESLALTLSGELERIRYQLNRVIGKDHWYEEPLTNLNTPFEDSNGTFHSNTGDDQTPAVNVKGGVFFDLDWDDNLTGLDATFRIGMNTNADSVRFFILRPGTFNDFAFRVIAPSSGSATIGGDAVATQAESEAGFLGNKIATPEGVSQYVTNRRATFAEAQEFSDSDKLMTPLRTHNTIQAKRATFAQAQAGTDNETLMTPLRVAQAIDARVGGGAGEVGTYGFLALDSGPASTFDPGDTRPGSDLKWASVGVPNLNSTENEIYVTSQGSPSGTWQAMGRAEHGSGTKKASLWLRIS